MLLGNFKKINIDGNKCLEKRCRKTIEPKLNYTQCGLHPGRGATNQIFTLQQSVLKSWEYANDAYICSSDLEKAYGGFLVKSFGSVAGVRR